VFIILHVFYYRLLIKLWHYIPELPVTARLSEGQHASLSLLRICIVTTRPSGNKSDFERRQLNVDFQNVGHITSHLCYWHGAVYSFECSMLLLLLLLLLLSLSSSSSSSSSSQLTSIELSLGGSSLALVQTKQIRINIHKRNNTKNTF